MIKIWKNTKTLEELIDDLTFTYHGTWYPGANQPNVLSAGGS